MRQYDLPTTPTVTFKNAAGRDCQLSVSQILDIHSDLHPKFAADAAGTELGIVMWWSRANRLMQTHIRKGDVDNLRALVAVGRRKLEETGWEAPGAAWVPIVAQLDPASPPDAD